jgi:UPF0271 protein
MVKQELVPESLPWVRFNIAASRNRLRLKTPHIHFLEKIRELSKRVGDILFLTEVDQQLLALALELKNAHQNPLIITDDYSIQNVATRMDVDFASLASLGICFSLQWVIYCPACYREYAQDYKQRHCEVCGTELKRKSLRKSPIRSQP